MATGYREEGRCTHLCLVERARENIRKHRAQSREMVWVSSRRQECDGEQLSGARVSEIDSKL